MGEAEEGEKIKNKKIKMLLVLLARGFQRLGCINPHLAIKTQKEALTLPDKR